MSILLVNDVCDLKYDNVKKVGLECFHMPFSVDGKRVEYDMGLEFDFEKFFSNYRKGLVVKPEEQSIEYYIWTLSEYLDANEDILYLHHSDKLSKYYDNLLLAIESLKEKYPNNTITLVDTENASLGYGIIAYEAGIKHKRGASDQEIIDYVNTIKNQIATYAVVDSVNELIDSHKLVTSQSVVGSALSVKSIVAMTNMGTIEVIEKHSSKKKAIQKLFDKLRQEGVNLKDYPIAISYVGDKANATDLKDKIEAEIGTDSIVWLQPMSPIVAMHLGYGSIVLSFHVTKKKY